MAGNDRKGITNVLGAILFVLAIVALTSVIAIVAAEYGNYVRSADYMSNLERERAMESLYFDVFYNQTSHELSFNMTNVCSTTVKITHLYVHKKTLDLITPIESISLPIVLNPGMSVRGLELGHQETGLENFVVMVMTSRGNNFLIIVEGGEVVSKS